MKLSELHKLEYETKGSLARNMMAKALRVGLTFSRCHDKSSGMRTGVWVDVATEAYETAVRNAFTDHAKEIDINRVTPEQALDLLVKAGIVDRDGKLTKPYRNGYQWVTRYTLL